jgi:hypothetical protein
MAVGDSWLYDEPTAISATTPGAQDSVTVSGTKTVLGAATSVFSIASTATGATTFDQYFSASAGGITFYGNNDSTDLVTNHTVPYAQILFPVVPGHVSHITAADWKIATDSAGNSITTTFDQQSSVAGLETVTVNAGVFPNSVKLVTTMTGTAMDQGTKQSIPIAATDAVWYAPGVGEVQEVQVTSVNNVPTNKSLAARGYTVAGVKHGLGFPGHLATNLHFGGNGESPQVATDGVNFLVVTSGMSGVVCELVDPSRSTLKTITLQAPWSQVMTVFDGTNYEVAFVPALPVGGTQSLYVQRITSAGATLDPLPGYIATTFTLGTGLVGMASGGGSALLLVTQYNSSSGLSSSAGILLTPDGVVHPNALFPVSSGAGGGGHPLAFDGTNYFAVWSDGTAIKGMRFDSTGAAVDLSPIIISSISGLQPSVSFDGTNYFVVWTGGSVASQIYGTRVTRAAAVLDGNVTTGGILLSSGTPAGAGSAVVGPVVGFNGVENFVVWLEISGTTWTIRGARVSPAAAVTSGAGFELGISDTEYSSGSPVTGTPPGLAFNSTTGLITWFVTDISQQSFHLDGCTVSPF